MACRITWEVEFSITECATYSGGDEVIPLAIAYTVEWSINTRGLTTRTCNGEIEIPPRRAGGGTSGIQLQEVVDEFRTRIYSIVSIPPGFRRSQNYAMSKDRKTLRFRISDTEIESDEAFFPGVIDMVCSHRTQSSFNGGPFGAGAFRAWTCDLNCSITLKRIFPSTSPTTSS